MSETLPQFGMIHGRFQPFHLGHLEYLLLAHERCQTLIVGITNPDPWAIAEEAASSHRHLAQSNPYTFFERQRMIRECLRDEAIPLDWVIFIPFPINLPERWPYYIPAGVVHYMRVFSPWEQEKADRLREHGFRVEILQPGVEKQIEATTVRDLMREAPGNHAWQELVPPGTARILREIEGSR